MVFKKKLFWYLIVGIFVLIQFYPMDKPAVIENNPDDLLLNNEIPLDVGNILKSSCYDCHSNRTRYPWYTSIAPVKWMMYDHIEEGREHLNFSDWNSLSKADMVEKLDDIYVVMEEKEMPLKSYTVVHAEAKLSEEDRVLVMQWTENLTEKLYD